MKRRSFLRLQAFLMLFGALWVLATVIACDVLFATRSTKITATLDGVAVPQSVVEQIEQEIGVSPVYKNKWYRTYIRVVYRDSLLTHAK